MVVCKVNHPDVKRIKLRESFQSTANSAASAAILIPFPEGTQHVPRLRSGSNLRPSLDATSINTGALFIKNHSYFIHISSRTVFKQVVETTRAILSNVCALSSVTPQPQY